MKKRSVAAVLLIPFITLGIYAIVWYVRTKNEMNALGAKIPTAWLMIIPIVNIYWAWKWSEGVDHVTQKALNAALAFVLIILLGPIGAAIIQSHFNKLASTPAPAPTPAS